MNKSMNENIHFRYLRCKGRGVPYIPFKEIEHLEKTTSRVTDLRRQTMEGCTISQPPNTPVRQAKSAAVVSPFKGIYGAPFSEVAIWYIIINM